MISSAREAHQDIERHKANKCDCCISGGGICEHREAATYLAALEGPEVKALIRTLENIAAHSSSPGAVRFADDALSQYREAIKK